MRRAVNHLRRDIHYRRDAFSEGLAAAGLQVVDAVDRPNPGDVLVIWNRYGAYGEMAYQWELRGGTVLVVENGYLGKNWRGGDWYALALGHHAGAGMWADGGPARWDAWEVELQPWRAGGGEVLVLGQRGIGEPSIACPDGWAERTIKRTGGRVRAHPHAKNSPASRPLLEDLAGVGAVITWASAAALCALVAGIPVYCAYPKWIGMSACRPLSEWPAPALRDDAARLAMFRRLAWAMWDLDEIRSGAAIRSVLGAVP